MKFILGMASNNAWSPRVKNRHGKAEYNNKDKNVMFYPDGGNPYRCVISKKDFIPDFKGGMTYRS